MYICLEIDYNIQMCVFAYLWPRVRYFCTPNSGIKEAEIGIYIKIFLYFITLLLPISKITPGHLICFLDGVAK